MTADTEKKEVDVQFLKPGMLLTGILFDAGGVMLWPARKPLTDSIIARFKVRGIEKVYYTPPKNKGEVSKYHSSEKVPIFTPETHEEAQNAIQEIVTQIQYGRIPNMNLVRQSIERFMTDLSAQPNGFLNLMVLRDYDTYTYVHSINVGILCMYLTRKLGFNEFFIEEMGIGGFLHDIGKVKIPSKIVNKHGNLTEDEFKIMKNHPVFGFNLIKDDKTLSNYVKKVLLFHHEKWDGSGYPLRLRAEAIGNFANICSVCDVYDALTTERSYKKPYLVNDALHFIMRNTLTHFSPYVAQRFINEMAQMYELGSFYPVGAFVILNTGETAVITAKESEYSMKPDINIIKNAKGMPLRTGIKVELKRDVSRVISKTIDEPDELERLAILMS